MSAAAAAAAELMLMVLQLQRIINGYGLAFRGCAVAWHEAALRQMFWERCV